MPHMRGNNVWLGRKGDEFCVGCAPKGIGSGLVVFDIESGINNTFRYVDDLVVLLIGKTRGEELLQVSKLPRLLSGNIAVSSGDELLTATFRNCGRCQRRQHQDADSNAAPEAWSTHFRTVMEVHESGSQPRRTVPSIPQVGGDGRILCDASVSTDCHPGAIRVGSELCAE